MLKNIHIKNYRGIKDLEIKDFKKINLFVGDNGVGKSSILDYIEENYSVYKIEPYIAFDIVCFRGVLTEELEEDQIKRRIIIIDAIGHNIHWSRQRSMWRELIKCCKKNDTQIFATTHSYDTIKALSEAYEEVKDLLGDDEIRLFKIKKLNTDETILGSIDCEVLQAKIEDNIEIR